MIFFDFITIVETIINNIIYQNKLSFIGQWYCSFQFKLWNVPTGKNNKKYTDNMFDGTRI